MTKLELYNAAYSHITSTNLKWFYDDTKGSEKIYAAYIKDDYGIGENTINFEGDEDIVIEISLANVLASDGTAGENWKAIGATALENAKDKYVVGDKTLAKSADKLTFYYGNDLEAGDTTKDLVDKVTLYSGTTQKAYLAFDFDLNVNLESIQVSFDENGKELATAVNSDTGWATTKDSSNNAINTGAKGVADNAATNATTKEIATMTWTALP